MAGRGCRLAPDDQKTENGFTPPLRSAEHGFTPSLRSAEHGFTPSLRSAEHGFTLLETLVALSIFSIAALTLVRLDAYSVRSTGDLGASSLAQIVATNAATDIITDPAAPTIGEASETVQNAGRIWQVSRSVSTTGDDSVLRVEILVRGQNDGQARLTIIRPAGKS